ncbi:MAG TPA: DUF438 domain-containing protein [Feifaniaceae bacterium]|nr:DUF438 domain-containing protein [Feifaniaceae bacterium]
MSREINNTEHRKTVIEQLIRQLHEGRTVDEVKAQFEEAFSGVSASEISAAEQALIAGGMDVSEVQRLCDVHAAVFKGSIAEIHREPQDVSCEAGHPLQTLRLENRALERLLEEEVKPRLHTFFRCSGEEEQEALAESVRALMKIDLHYSKKENLLFPLLEQHGITAPPKVMWGVDDEIRGLLKASLLALEAGRGGEAVHLLEEAAAKIGEMIFKEENILFPMLLETLTSEEWAGIAKEQGEIGYFLIPAQPAWAPKGEAQPEPKPELTAGQIRLPTGVFSVEELTRVLNTLPFDITFVDAEDTVKYFSENKERVFPRTRAIIGRKVINCHPPASMHVVQGILDDFRAGRKEQEDFWIKMGNRYLLIRYYAVRDETGKFLGTLEVTQDISPIQAVTGEKRLVSPS